MEQGLKTMMSRFRDIAHEVVPSGGHVWLYGSRARGDANNDSDWDLLILIDKDKIVSADEDNIAYPFVYAGWKNATVVTPLIYTFDEWNLRSASPFYKNVEREKILIS